MIEADTPALDAEPMLTTAAPECGATDAVTTYQEEVAALAATPVPAGYVDPHDEDAADRDPDAGDDFARDPDAGGLDEDGASPADLDDQGADAFDEMNEELLATDDAQALAMTVDGRRPPQFRLRPKDGDVLGEAALRLMRRHPELTLEDAVAQARGDLGLSTEGEEFALLPEADALGAAEPVQELEAERMDLRHQKREALKWLDYDRVAALEERLDALDESLIPQAREAEARRVQEVNESFHQSAATAAELYPEAGHPDSPMHQRMMEIEQDLIAAGDPLVYDPAKPLRIAQM